MPRSTDRFKTDIQNYVVANFPPSINILDVGVGEGTYYALLSRVGYTNIDGVEIFAPYLDTFQLTTMYRKVFVGDINQLNLDFKSYQLIILGDVVEHMEAQVAVDLLLKLKGIDMIVAVPFGGEQGEVYGNIHETHIQLDLNEHVFKSRYIGFHPLCLRSDYGVFVNRVVGEPIREI